MHIMFYDTFLNILEYLKNWPHIWGSEKTFFNDYYQDKSQPVVNPGLLASLLAMRAPNGP